MKQKDFYSFSFNSNNIELFMEVIGDYDCQKLNIGGYSPNPLRLRKSQGRKNYDIVRLQDVFNFLISKKLFNAFHEYKLTGWKTYNIESELNFVNEYKGFQCIGKCGAPIRPKKKGFITGYNFDYKTWDGSDFFIPENTMMIICTKKAKDTIEKFDIKNIEIENLDHYEWYNI